MTPELRRQWAIVGASGLLTGMGHGFVQVAVSAILKPVAADLALSRAGVSGAIALGRLVQGLVSLGAGHGVDRLGSRRVVAVGTAVMALGLGLTALAEGALGLYLAWGLLVSAGTSLAFTVAMDRTVLANVEARRGLALAVRFTVVALVTTLQLPLIVWIVTAHGWRAACLTWAVLLLLTLPLPLLLFEGARAPKSETDAPSMSLRRALATRDYWIIAFAYMAMAGTISGLSVHAIPMMTDRGWSLAGASAVVAALILLSVPARLATGLLSDRLAPRAMPRLLGAVLATLGLTILADAVWRSEASLLAMMLAKGAATGVPTVMILMIAVARFGRENIGAIQGSFMLCQVPGTMSGPVLAGWVYDTTGSYASALAVFAGMLLAAGLALQFTGPMEAP